jgi:hypothetical protein
LTPSPLLFELIVDTLATESATRGRNDNGSNNDNDNNDPIDNNNMDGGGGSGGGGAGRAPAIVRGCCRLLATLVPRVNATDADDALTRLRKPLRRCM